MFMVKDNNTLTHYSQCAAALALNNSQTYNSKMSNLRENIQRELDKLGWNAYHLADASGVSQPTIHRILSGQHSDPKTNTVKKLATALKLTEAELRGINNQITSSFATGELPKPLQPGFSLSIGAKIIRMRALAWSEYCKNTNSINKIKELEIMIIDNGINVSEEIYAIDLDNNTFKGFPMGTRILIDPKRTPEKNNTVVLSIDDGIPTLVRWNPGLGLLQVEPLESGYPNSISLEGKTYAILGVAVWWTYNGGALV